MSAEVGTCKAHQPCVALSRAPAILPIRSPKHAPPSARMPICLPAHSPARPLSAWSLAPSLTWQRSEAEAQEKLHTVVQLPLVCTDKGVVQSQKERT